MSVQVPTESALTAIDPEVAALVEEEVERQARTLCLIPSENHVSPAVLEALGRFAYPLPRFDPFIAKLDSLKRKLEEAAKRAKRYGIGYAGVTNSHHFGAAAYHLASVAQAGLVGLAFTNSPAAINAWGGRKAFFGTNPISAIFPCRNADPVVIDLALTEVVRGKIMLYAKEGKPIPLGWAVDRDGKPTPIYRIEPVQRLGTQ